MEKTIKIKGMSCNHCKMRVEKALNGIDGVQKAVVNLNEKSANINFDENKTNVSDFKKAVENAGYQFVS